MALTASGVYLQASVDRNPDSAAAVLNAAKVLNRYGPGRTARNSFVGEVENPFGRASSQHFGTFAIKAYVTPIFCHWLRKFVIPIA